MSLEDAKDILSRISSLHSSLARGERERNWLLSELANLCREAGLPLPASVHGGPSSAFLQPASGAGAPGGGFPAALGGSRVAHMTRLRLQMHETRQLVEELQLQLAQVRP